jgi:hypothetical protein
MAASRVKQSAFRSASEQIMDGTEVERALDMCWGPSAPPVEPNLKGLDSAPLIHISCFLDASVA